MKASGFTEEFDRVADIVHTEAVEKGWWEKPRNDYEMIALMHSELSEAVEGLRKGNPPSEKIGDLGFTQAEEELADTVIRIMDMAAGRGWKLGAAIREKIVYNMMRPYRHGGKLA